MVTQLPKRETVSGLGLLGMLNQKMVLFSIIILSSQEGNGILINFQGCCEQELGSEETAPSFFFFWQPW
jgi:hypothetical protein